MVVDGILTYYVVESLTAHPHVPLTQFALLIHLHALLAAQIERVAHSQQTLRVLHLRQDMLETLLAVPQPV